MIKHLFWTHWTQKNLKVGGRVGGWWGEPWGGGKVAKLAKNHPLMEVVVKNDKNQNC